MVSNNNVEELETLVKNTTISIEYINLLNQLSRELLKQDVRNQRALRLAKEAYDLCTAHFSDHHTGRINALITMGEYHRFQYNYAEVIRLHLQAEAVYTEADDLNDLIRLKSAQAALASMMLDWTRYINVNLELLHLAQQAGQPKDEAEAYNSLAVAHETLNDFEAAIRYREKAATIAQSISDEAYYAFSLLGHSPPYIKLKQYDKALTYAELAYEFYHRKNTTHEALNLGIFGNIYMEIGNYQQAHHYFQRQLNLVNALEFEYFKPGIYCDLGELYYKEGDIGSGIHWLEAGISLAEANDRNKILLGNYHYLVQAYKANRDFEKALETIEKLDALKTQIHDTTVDNQRIKMLIMHETEQARVEAEIQRQRVIDIEKRAQQDREYFEELTRLQKEGVHAITHDLKNPLTIIVMKLETLKLITDEQHHKHLTVVEDQAMRLNNMISDMLEIAKLETKRMLTLRLGSLVTLIIEEIEQHTLQSERKGITINFVPPQDAFEYHFDPIYLKRALNNLIANAVKYSGDNTCVEVEMVSTHEEIIISISDSGFGISPEDLPFIFDRFFRVKSNHNIKGTGLGLSIVKSIIEQHNGYVHVDSTLGIGSTFSIHLPLSYADCS